MSAERYRTVLPYKPLVLDGRFYIALKDPRIVVPDQPRRGFATQALAETFLAGMVGMDWQLGKEFEIVTKEQIDFGTV